jgi:hypothetical protein
LRDEVDEISVRLATHGEGVTGGEFGAEDAQQASGVRGRAAAYGVLFKHDNVRASTGQLIGNCGSNGSSTDYNNIGCIRSV